MAQVKEVSSKAINRRCFLSLVATSVAVLSICLAVSQASGGRKSVSSPAPMDPVVATINGEPVSAAEYRLVMERKVSLVYSYFKEHQNLDDHLGYWSESSGSDGPLAKLREVIRAELIRIKVCQGLAKKKGLLQDTSFASFQAGYELENARRAKAMTAGQVVYGPPQYRKTALYYIHQGDLDFRLKQAMAREAAPKIMPDEVEKFYQENKASLRDTTPVDARPRIAAFLATQEAEKELAALCASARVEMNEALVRPIVPRADPEPSQPNRITALQH